MAYEEALRTITLLADSSIGVYTGVPDMPGSADPNYGEQHRFVKVTGVRTAGLCTAATDPEVGILQNKPQHTGDPATVAIGGVSKLSCASAITAGDLVAPDSTGRGVTDNTNGKWRALTTTTAANQLVSVFHS